MAVQVWIGEKPEHPQERRAIVTLAKGLERLDGLYLILANFSVGGRTIDLVIIKPDGIFIIELKYCDGKVFGDVNGPWVVEGSNGERKRLNPGRKNPYNQVISYYYSLVNYLNDNRVRFLSAQKATSVDFRTCRRLVVIAPVIQEGSKIDTDWKVDLRGLDELPAYVLTERSSEISLTEEEMLVIPDMLHCTHWAEIEVLLAAPTPAPATPPAEPVAVPEPVAAMPMAAPGVWQQRMVWLTGSWAGRAVAASIVVLVLLASMILRPAAAPISDQPAPMTASTSLPAGSDSGVAIEARSCVWNGFQPVGRRRGSSPNTWESTGVEGVAQALSPDVVVTLEEVAYCDGSITITWSLRNNTSDTVIALPLNQDNISVSDALGNSYSIVDARSQPLELRADPHSKQQGTAVIDQPINQNAPTLVIKLLRQPFGEATWLVPIQSS